MKTALINESLWNLLFFVFNEKKRQNIPGQESMFINEKPPKYIFMAEGSNIVISTKGNINEYSKPLSLKVYGDTLLEIFKTKSGY